MSYNLSLNQGPIDNSLLYLGEEHKARTLFLNPERGDVPRIDFKRGDAGLWRHIKEENISIGVTVEHYIRRLGFEGMVSIGKGRKIDRPLVEALIERWRPETNTFHMPFGEVTITLEDVNVLWGLPIEGPAIVPLEVSFTPDERVERCQRLLGFTPGPNDFRNNTIKFGRILQFLSTQGVNVEDDDTLCRQHARCICLILITNNLFADTSNAYASLHMLSLLENIDACRNLSWGSAALAYLYRELTKGTDLKTVALGGPMLLVQVWAWTRIRSLAPRILNEQVQWGKAYGARWSYGKISVKEKVFMVKTRLQTSDETGDSPYKVMLRKKTCTCGKWQIYRFPCSHAIAVCHYMKEDPKRIVSKRFHTDTYRAQYSQGYYPVSHKEDWIHAGWTLYRDSSKITILRGRRRARRMHNEMDDTYAQERTGRLCSGCKQPGHMINHCPNLPN